VCAGVCLRAAEEPLSLSCWPSTGRRIMQLRLLTDGPSVARPGCVNSRTSLHCLAAVGCCQPVEHRDVCKKRLVSSGLPSNIHRAFIVAPTLATSPPPRSVRFTHNAHRTVQITKTLTIPQTVPSCKFFPLC